MEDASRRPLQALDGSKGALNKQLKTLETQLKKSEQLGDAIFSNIVGEFYEKATDERDALVKDLDETVGRYKKLVKLFCLDPSKTKSEDFFGIFHNFNLHYKKAIADNERNKAKVRWFSMFFSP